VLARREAFDVKDAYGVGRELLSAELAGEAPFEFRRRDGDFLERERRAVGLQ
jgi:hypothetical protein